MLLFLRTFMCWQLFRIVNLYRNILYIAHLSQKRAEVGKPFRQRSDTLIFYRQKQHEMKGPRTFFIFIRKSWDFLELWTIFVCLILYSQLWIYSTTKCDFNFHAHSTRYLHICMINEKCNNIFSLKIWNCQLRIIFCSNAFCKSKFLVSTLIADRS